MKEILESKERLKAYTKEVPGGIEIDVHLMAIDMIGVLKFHDMNKEEFLVLMKEIWDNVVIKVSTSKGTM